MALLKPTPELHSSPFQKREQTRPRDEGFRSSSGLPVDDSCPVLLGRGCASIRTRTVGQHACSTDLHEMSFGLEEDFLQDDEQYNARSSFASTCML